MRYASFTHLPALAFAGAAIFLTSGCTTVSLTPSASITPARTATPSSKFYLDDGPMKGVTQEMVERLIEPTPIREPLNRFTKRPYSVMGNNFTPMTGLFPYRVQGIGSWYGTRYHGKPTAIGEPYDLLKLTAAHPTLPLPCYARVTNLENGKSVIVRVNDRGPFLHDRVIDLSYAAALRLGYAAKGSANVEVELIIPE